MSSENKNQNNSDENIEKMKELLAKYDEMIEEGTLLSKPVLRIVKKNAEMIREKLAANAQRDFEGTGDSTWSACSIQ